MYDAILIVSFGGPEGPDDVLPFLENVLRGRNVPRERMLEVAEHYQHFGGVSPINDQCRSLIAALRPELDRIGIELPIYWGNRNWHPMLTDTVRKMKQDGVRRALAFVTSGFSCYSGCRQYREDIAGALQEADAEDLVVDKIRVFYNHPDFIDVVSAEVSASVQEAADGTDEPVRVAFTAHSIPMSMANTSDYVKQLRETCRLVAGNLGLPEDRWDLVYQSRSGRPQDPWLEPDICDFIREQHAAGMKRLVISPVGFLSDHMEVLYDLDDEAAALCDELEVVMKRAATPGVDPRFVTMIGKLIQERLGAARPEAIGCFGPNHDVCPVDCCPAPVRRRPAAT